MTLKSIFRMIRGLLRRYGIDVARYRGPYPPDFLPRHGEIWEAVRAYTMTNPVRIKVLIDAVNYLEDNGIDGAFVECGLWRGGSAMAMAYALLDRKRPDREFFLYDTFSGMTQPTELDVYYTGGAALPEFEKQKSLTDDSGWCAASLEDVQANLASTGYPMERMRFIVGKVEDTIPDQMPDRIALLRLDTDWYESTKHELLHLFPLLTDGGVLIIDDYGAWEGAKKAVDEYFAEARQRIFLCRVDFDSRIAVKAASSSPGDRGIGC